MRHRGAEFLLLATAAAIVAAAPEQRWLNYGRAAGEVVVTWSSNYTGDEAAQWATVSGGPYTTSDAADVFACAWECGACRPSALCVGTA